MVQLKTLMCRLCVQDKGRPLPKFGEWDVNNPASAEGFTVIFNKARDEKKTNTYNNVTPRRNDPIYQNEPQYPRRSKWFCCG
ncbi:RPM1-interacting protein 4-like [Trifolium pratense]|uniref:RPM1-interacting protein 4-like n=1 Tax=Trifolium pratense TaxID=57577 RepID=A0A2K3LIH0_TRIPR|nr:RPM1-interacting protein 4-like [Trifolium pratense]